MPRQSTRTKKPATKAAEPEKVEKIVEEKPQKEQKKRGRNPKQRVVEETPVEDKMEVEEEEQKEEEIQTKADEQQPEQKEEAGSDSEEEDNNDLDLNALDESDSDSEFERDLNEKQSAAGIQANKYQNQKAEESSDDEDDEDEIDIDELDVEGEEGEEVKAISKARQTINNKQGLLTALKRFALDTSDKVPFAFHQSIVAKKATEESIPSIDDDLARELAFMNQALEAARIGRALLRKEGVPFTRPTDYFAETLRSDETMEKVKAKLIEEATAKKASAEARKQRDLKKFGKQVQVAKQQERAKQKRDTLEKINLLKKKRKDGGGPTGANEAEDLFDVAVDNELKGAAGGNSKKRGRDGKEGGGPNAKRQRKDAKFGFGGKKKYLKSNDALSSGDVSGFSARKMKSGGGAGGPGKPKKFKPAPRPGKARRKASAGKR